MPQARDQLMEELTQVWSGNVWLRWVSYLQCHKYASNSTQMWKEHNFGCTWFREQRRLDNCGKVELVDSVEILYLDHQISQDFGRHIR